MSEPEEPSPRAPRRRPCRGVGGDRIPPERDQTVHVAGLYAEGQRCLTLHHGELETAPDEQSCLALLEVLHEHAGREVSRVRT